MQEAASTVEREGKRRPAVPFAPGNPGGPGRPKGMPNKVTRTIREAVMESIEPGNCHPDGLAGWLIERARGGIEDRKIYAAVVSRVIPIEITGEGGGPVKIDLGWLTGRKIGGGEVIDITPTTQSAAEQESARLPTDFQSEAPMQTPAPVIVEPVAEPVKAKTTARTPGKAKPAKSRLSKGELE